MKLGIYLNSQHPASDDPARRFAETLEQVRLIRSLGFDSIWAGEHHVTPGFHFFPQLALLQRLAADAEGLWLGTNVTLLPLHNPIDRQAGRIRRACGFGKARGEPGRAVPARGYPDDPGLRLDRPCHRHDDRALDRLRDGVRLSIGIRKEISKWLS
jgi:hypothetical protein